MTNPSIKQLEAFWWAATCANFTTAAERLHLSVSSLSKRISELETVMGEPLFDRSGHRAVLTLYGQRLLPAALNVLNSISALGQVQDSKMALSGRCRFGIGDLSALTWLAAFVAAVRAAHPQLELEPYVDVGSVLEHRLDAGELDFAVVAGRSSRSGLQSQQVGAATFVWTARADLVKLHPEGPGDLLKHYPLISLPSGAGTTRLLDDWLLTHEVTVGQRILCNSWGGVAGMLRIGIGVGFLPADWLAPLGLAGIDEATPLAPLNYAFQWRRGDSRVLICAMKKLVRAQVHFGLAGQWPPA